MRVICRTERLRLHPIEGNAMYLTFVILQCKLTHKVILVLTWRKALFNYDIESVLIVSPKRVLVVLPVSDLDMPAFQEIYMLRSST